MSLHAVVVLFLSSVTCAKLSVPLSVLTSSSTPESLLQQVPSYLSTMHIALETQFAPDLEVILFWEHLDLTVNALGNFYPESLSPEKTRVIFDVTCDAAYSRYLAYQAFLSDILQIVIGRTVESGEVPGPNTLFMEPAPSEQAFVFAQVIETYKWKNIGLFTTAESKHQQSAAKLKDLVKTFGAQIYYEEVVTVRETNDIAYLKSQVAMSKITDAAVFVVFADAVSAAQVLLYADENSIGGSGFVWLLSSDSMDNINHLTKLSNADVNNALFGLIKTGIVGLRDAERTPPDDVNTYLTIGTLAVQAYQSGAVTGTAMRSYYLTNPPLRGWLSSISFTSDGFHREKLTLLNMADFSLLEIGYWDWTLRKVVPNGRKIVWPGGGTQVPDDTLTILKIAVLIPLTDVSGNKTKEGVTIRQGIEMAINDVNSAAELSSNSVFSAIYLDTADTPNLAAANLNFIASANVLGFIGPLASYLVSAYVQADQSLPDDKPIVSYGASSTNLTDPSATPFFLRTIQPDNDEGVALALFVKKNEWKRVGVVYTDDDYGRGLYSGFMSNVEELNIVVDNSESKRRVGITDSTKLDDASLKDIDTAVANLIAAQIRVVVYLGSWRVGAELVLRASKKQLTGSLNAWIGAIWLSPDILTSLRGIYSATDYQDLITALEGCIALKHLSPMGVVGSAFQAEYEARFKESPSVFAMLAHDTVHLYARAISSMIARGEDYNRGKDLLDALRTTEFTGASGTVHFSGGSNDRSAYGYTLLNMQSSQLQEVFHYDPLSPTIFNATAVAIKWAGSEVPGDSFSPYSCPFPEHMVTISVPGVIIVIAIGSALFVVTLGLSLFSYKKWKLVEIRPITEHIRKTWKDFLVQLGIVIEFFQLMALAPTLPVLQVVIDVMSNLAMLDPMKLLNLPTPFYWAQLIVICVMCDVWFLLVLLIMINAEKWIHKIPSLKKILSMVTDLYLPLAGNLLFFPFLAQLLDAIVCDHQMQGQSFVWRDCYMNCWTQEHAPYVAICLIAVVFYEPLAVYSQPMWQQADVDTSLMMKPFFLLFQTCTQILLIAVGKSLQGTSEIAHGCVFSILMLAYAIVSIRERPFNYHRCNLWEISSLVSVTIYSFVATLSRAYNPTHIGWFAGLAASWGIIGVTALVIQWKYMPSLFRPPAGVAGRKSVPEAIAGSRHARRQALGVVVGDQPAEDQGDSPALPNNPPNSPPSPPGSPMKEQQFDESTTLHY